MPAFDQSAFNFQSLPIQKQQDLLDSILHSKQYEKLTLINCTVLTKDFFKELLKESPRLKSLELINSDGKNLGESITNFLLKTKYLTELVLDGSKIKRIGFWEVKMEFQNLMDPNNPTRTNNIIHRTHCPILSSSLKHLSVKGCSQLTELAFQANGLLSLNLENTYSLKKVYVGIPNDKRLSSQLKIKKEHHWLAIYRVNHFSPNPSENEYCGENYFHHTRYPIDLPYSKKASPFLEGSIPNSQSPQQIFFHLMERANLETVQSYYAEHRNLIDLYETNHLGKTLLEVSFKSEIEYSLTRTPVTRRASQVKKFLQLAPKSRWILNHTLLNLSKEYQEIFYSILQERDFSEELIQDIQKHLTYCQKRKGLIEQLSDNHFSLNLAYRQSKAISKGFRWLRSNILNREKADLIYDINLSYLNLDNNQISQWLDIIKKIPHRLVYLNLSGNQMGAGSFYQFFHLKSSSNSFSIVNELVREGCHLKKLMIEHSGLSDSDIALLISSLQSRQHPLFYCSIQGNPKVSAKMAVTFQMEILFCQLRTFLKGDFLDTTDKLSFVRAIKEQYQRYLAAESTLLSDDRMTLPLFRFNHFFCSKNERYNQRLIDLVETVPELLTFSNAQGENFLETALLEGDLERADYLLQLGVNWRTENHNQQTLWHQLLTLPHNKTRERTFKWLWRVSSYSSEYLSQVDSCGYNPFLLAIRKGDLAAAQFFRSIDSNTQLVDMWGRQAWHLTAWIEDPDKQKAMLDYLSELVELTPLKSTPCEPGPFSTQTPILHAILEQPERAIKNFFNVEGMVNTPKEQCHIGMILLNGEKGIEKDREKGIDFLRKAARGRDQKAKKILRKIWPDYRKQKIRQIKQNKPSLDRLSLTDWQMTDEDFLLFFQALEKNSHIHTINLDFNSLTKESFYRLAYLLAKNHHIKEVTFSNNSAFTTYRVSEINELIAGIIEPLLQINRNEAVQLREADLHGCRKQAVIDLFFPILKNFQTLESLNLSHLELETDSDQNFALCQYLRKNCSLKRLNLSYNNYDNDMLLLLAAAMEENQTLEEIDLSVNKIRVINKDYHQKGYSVLQNSFRQNSRLASIDVSGNWFEAAKDDYMPTQDEKDNDPNMRQPTIDVYVEPSEHPFFKPEDLFTSSANLTIESMLHPRHQLAGDHTSSPTWVVSRARLEGAQHTQMFLEGIRPSGQRFLECYHLVDKNRCTSANMAKIEIKRFDLNGKTGEVQPKAFNRKKWKLTTFSISTDDGKKLREKMIRSHGKKPRYNLFPYLLPKLLNPYEGVNCKTWVDDIFRKELGIDIPDHSMIPSRGDNVNFSGEQSILMKRR